MGSDVTTGDVIVSLFYILIPLTAFIVAGILAFHGLGGWGWFLFAGIISCPNIKLGVKDGGEIK